jgi:hypothetical protein
MQNLDQGIVGELTEEFAKILKNPTKATKKMDGNQKL